MTLEPCFRGDFYEIYNRQCLVFPCEGLDPCLTRMTIRTVTTDDISNAKLYNRTVDLLDTYGC